jgi:hypothetical protein
MVNMPQQGGCLCGDIRYALREDPVTVYACHCTDCQTETGSGFYLSVVVRADALVYTKGRPETYEVQLADGRKKGAYYCQRCTARVGGASSLPGIASVDGGSLDDTSWLVPAGHIWTRSAQPWIRLPEQSLKFPMQPRDEDFVAMVRAWKEGSLGTSR